MAFQFRYAPVNVFVENKALQRKESPLSARRTSMVGRLFLRMICRILISFKHASIRGFTAPYRHITYMTGTSLLLSPVQCVDQQRGLHRALHFRQESLVLAEEYTCLRNSFNLEHMGL
jgi:hypothetical protein